MVSLALLSSVNLFAKGEQYLVAGSGWDKVAIIDRDTKAPVWMTVLPDCFLLGTLSLCLISVIQGQDKEGMRSTFASLPGCPVYTPASFTFLGFSPR